MGGATSQLFPYPVVTRKPSIQVKPKPQPLPYACNSFLLYSTGTSAFDLCCGINCPVLTHWMPLVEYCFICLRCHTLATFFSTETTKFNHLQQHDSETIEDSYVRIMRRLVTLNPHFSRLHRNSWPARLYNTLQPLT